jgi:NitT/TauT family transport system permease protein
MAALPSVLTGCRIALIISCIVVFLAEGDQVDMFVPLISISILGLTLNAAFNRRRG